MAQRGTAPNVWIMCARSARLATIRKRIGPSATNARKKWAPKTRIRDLMIRTTDRRQGSIGANDEQRADSTNARDREDGAGRRQVRSVRDQDSGAGAIA